MLKLPARADRKPESTFRSLPGALFALALAAGLASFAAPAAAVERWVPLGPSGGIVRDLARAPSDRERLYAITSEAGLGLYRSRDAGRSWQSINQGLEGASVICVSVAPRDPDFLVASTGAFQIWHSRDGGATWIPAARPPRTEDGGGIQTFHLLFATSSARRIYAGTDRGIWRSLDGGATWDSWALPNVFVSAIAHDPAAPEAWYASGSETIDNPNHGVFRSDDGGRTWSLAASAGGPDLYEPDRLFLRADALYAQWLGVLFRSTDGAATWSLAARLPALSASDFALASSGRIYAATDLGIYTSTDGVTWSPPEATSTDQAAPSDKISRLALLPGAPGANSETVIAAGQRGVWRSTGGGGWAPSSRGITERVVGSLVVIGNPQGTVLASFDDGLMRIDRAGDRWQRLPRQAGFEAPVLAADPHHPGRVYALGDDFGVSEDQGKTWTTLSHLPNRGVDLLRVDPVHPGVLYASVRIEIVSQDYSFAYRSVDGGAHWREILSEQTLIDVVFDPAHPDVGFRLRYSGLDKSDDGGATWTPIPDFGSQLLGANPTSLLFDPRSRALFLGTDRRGVFRSTDSGRTFRRVAAGLPRLPGGLNPTVATLILDAGGDLYAAHWFAGVYRLVQGHGWTEVGTGLSLQTFPIALVADPERPGLIYAPTYTASVLRLEDR